MFDGSSATLPDRQINIDFAAWLSSPFSKNIPLRYLPKSKLYHSHPASLEGRIAIVTDVEAGCGGREWRAQTNGACCGR
jgi:hypothetical protein